MRTHGPVPNCPESTQNREVSLYTVHITLEQLTHSILEAASTYIGHVGSLFLGGHKLFEGL